MKRIRMLSLLAAAAFLTACGTDADPAAETYSETAAAETTVVQTETTVTETAPVTAATESVPPVSETAPAQTQVLQPSSEGTPGGEQQAAQTQAPAPAEQNASQFAGKWEVERIDDHDAYLGQYGYEKYCVWYQTELSDDGSAVMYERGVHRTRQGTWQPSGSGIRLQLSPGGNVGEFPDDLPLELRDGLLCGTNEYGQEIVFRQVDAFSQPTEPAYYDIAGKWIGDHGVPDAQGSDVERSYFGGAPITELCVDIHAYQGFALLRFLNVNSDTYDMNRDEFGVVALGGNRFRLNAGESDWVQYGKTFRLEGDLLIFEPENGSTKELVYRRQ